MRSDAFIPIKACTLWNPWPFLIATGVKSYETRHWPTSYRGLLGIHAAAKRDREIQMYCEQPAIQRVLRQHGRHFGNLAYGAMICVVRLTDCYPTSVVAPQQQKFGDFSHGRFAWKLELVAVLPSPVHMSGAQQLWNWNCPREYLEVA